jgi:hypothetical protein
LTFVFAVLVESTHKCNINGVNLAVSLLHCAGGLVS